MKQRLGLDGQCRRLISQALPNLQKIQINKKMAFFGEKNYTQRIIIKLLKMFDCLISRWIST
jgi:hypothetical protein